MTLISFIGKGSKLNSANSNANSTDSRNKTGYRKTRYTLNGQTSSEVTFICKALYDFIKPEKILIIGTVGSSWSEVLSNFLSDEKLANHSSLYERLIKREDSNIGDSRENVSRDVEEISRLISKELNIKFRCRIYDENSENELFTTIVENISKGDTISLDVTHGFRFTPMCALMAIQYLTFIKKVEIEKIYYGWLENNEAIKPIKDLSWILSLNKWITAFSQYNKTNDISIFSPLIGNQVAENTINTASFFEKLTDASDSIDKLKKLRAYA
jgi:CRISPR-associated Csx2 family protein